MRVYKKTSTTNQIAYHLTGIVSRFYNGFSSLFHSHAEHFDFLGTFDHYPHLLSHFNAKKILARQIKFTEVYLNQYKFAQIEKQSAKQYSGLAKQKLLHIEKEAISTLKIIFSNLIDNSEEQIPSLAIFLSGFHKLLSRCAQDDYQRDLVYILKSAISDLYSKLAANKEILIDYFYTDITYSLLELAGGVSSWQKISKRLAFYQVIAHSGRLLIATDLYVAAVNILHKFCIEQDIDMNDEYCNPLIPSVKKISVALALQNIDHFFSKHFDKLENKQNLEERVELPNMHNQHNRMQRHRGTQSYSSWPYLAMMIFAQVSSSMAAANYTFDNQDTGQLIGAKLVNGPFGNSLYFNGITDYMIDDVDFNGSGNFTIVIDFQMDSVVGGPTLLSLGQLPNLGCPDSNGLVLYVNDALSPDAYNLQIGCGFRLELPYAAAPVGVPHRATITKNGNTFCLNVDGSNACGPNTHGDNIGGNKIALGTLLAHPLPYSDANVKPFQGLIKRFYIFDRIVAEHEIVLPEREPIPENADSPISQSANLVSRWSMNHSLIDLSGNGNTATAYGPVRNVPDRYGRDGEAMFFSDNAYVLADADVLATGEPYSISYWFQYSDTERTSVPFSMANAKGCGKAFLITINNKSDDFCRNGIEIQSHCTEDRSCHHFENNPPVGSWHRFTFVTSASGSRYYINATLVHSDSNFLSETSFSGTKIAIAVGGTSGTEAPYLNTSYVGAIDTVEIYRGEITEDEITTSYNIYNDWRELNQQRFVAAASNNENSSSENQISTSTETLATSDHDEMTSAEGASTTEAESNPTGPVIAGANDDSSSDTSRHQYFTLILGAGVGGIATMSCTLGILIMLLLRKRGQQRRRPSPQDIENGSVYSAVAMNQVYGPRSAVFNSPGAQDGATASHGEPKAMASSLR